MNPATMNSSPEIIALECVDAAVNPNAMRNLNAMTVRCQVIMPARSAAIDSVASQSNCNRYKSN